jgi:putative transcriptional regulator
MAKLSEKALLKRDAERNIGEELLQAVEEMKAGKAARIHRVKMSDVTAARSRAGISQSQLAGLLGVSTRTLQEWEQGRRQPSGAAQTLLAIAARHPEVLREMLIGTPTHETRARA